MKQLLKFFFLIFVATAPLCFAQDGGATEQKKSQQVEKKADTDFFDTAAEAPANYKGAFVKMMLTLLALVVLIVISVWLLRRISHGRIKQMNYGRSIKVLERRPLSAKSVLYLVEISGKKVVVAESQLEVRAITTADHLPLEE